MDNIFGEWIKVFDEQNTSTIEDLLSSMEDLSVYDKG